jgi:hypothetical protein
LAEHWLGRKRRFLFLPPLLLLLLFILTSLCFTNFVHSARISGSSAIRVTGHWPGPCPDPSVIAAAVIA